MYTPENTLYQSNESCQHHLYRNLKGRLWKRPCKKRPFYELCTGYTNDEPDGTYHSSISLELLHSRPGSIATRELTSIRSWSRASVTWQKRKKNKNIKKEKCTTPYQPTGNGMIERFNKTLPNMFGILQDSQKADWKAHVSTLTHTYNAATHDSPGFSTFFLMFRRHHRLAVDAFTGIPQSKEQVGYYQR